MTSRRVARDPEGERRIDDGDAANLSTPGTYALILQCPSAWTVRIGRLRSIDFLPGYYVYVGSALGPGGLARLRLFTRDFRHFWRFDDLK